jgi:hypothetical protein
MAHDLALGRTSRDWSCGSLPDGARGYVPRRWWTQEQAEGEVQKSMKGGGTFGGQLPRVAAEKVVLDRMKAEKIGITSSSGSILLPDKQQREFFAKIDEIRYDLRHAQKNISAGLLALGAGVALVAVSKIYDAATK